MSVSTWRSRRVRSRCSFLSSEGEGTLQPLPAGAACTLTCFKNVQRLGLLPPDDDSAPYVSGVRRGAPGEVPEARGAVSPEGGPERRKLSGTLPIGADADFEKVTLTLAAGGGAKSASAKGVGDGFPEAGRRGPQAPTEHMGAGPGQSRRRRPGARGSHRVHSPAAIWGAAADPGAWSVPRADSCRRPPIPASRDEMHT